MSDELAQVEEQWRQIVEERDVAAAERFLADDFMLSSSGGVADRVTRQDWLDNLPAMETHSLTCDVLDSRVFDDLAVVRARLQWDVAFGDRDLSGAYVVADVFRREEGRWRAVWRISTRLGS